MLIFKGGGYDTGPNIGKLPGVLGEASHTLDSESDNYCNRFGNNSGLVAMSSKTAVLIFRNLCPHSKLRFLQNNRKLERL